jgi:hypothetical protein
MANQKDQDEGMLFILSPSLNPTSLRRRLYEPEAAGGGSEIPLAYAW